MDTNQSWLQIGSCQVGTDGREYYWGCIIHRLRQIFLYLKNLVYFQSVFFYRIVCMQGIRLRELVLVRLEATKQWNSNQTLLFDFVPNMQRILFLLTFVHNKCFQLLLWNDSYTETRKFEIYSILTLSPLLP